MSTTATATDNSPRWYQPTPARLLVILLVVEGILLLSQQWLPKGYAVPTAIASVGVTMVLMLGWWLVALCFHWRFQFSLRSLSVATVAVAIPFSWLAVEVKRAREQRGAVEALAKLGGSINYDYEISSGGYLINGAKQPGPAWLRNIIGDGFFINVNGANCTLLKVTDVDLEYLEAWKQLRHLQLGSTKSRTLVWNTSMGLSHYNVST